MCELEMRGDEPAGDEQHESLDGGDGRRRRWLCPMPRPMPPIGRQQQQLHEHTDVLDAREVSLAEVAPLRPPWPLIIDPLAVITSPSSLTAP